MAAQDPVLKEIVFFLFSWRNVNGSPSTQPDVAGLMEPWFNHLGQDWGWNIALRQSGRDLFRVTYFEPFGLKKDPVYILCWEKNNSEMSLFWPSSNMIIHVFASAIHLQSEILLSNILITQLPTAHTWYLSIFYTDTFWGLKILHPKLRKVTKIALRQNSMNLWHKFLHGKIV